MSNPLFPDRIETDRLLLEPLHESVDLIEYYEACSGDDIDDVTQYMPWETHATPKESVDYLDRCERRWDDGEAVNFAVRPRDGEDGAGEFAGVATVKFDWERKQAQTGLWFKKRFWGRGYSEERAAAIFELAFDRLDLEIVVVGHITGNENSERAIQRYIERFGGESEGIRRKNIPMDDDLHDEHVYSVTKEEYRAAIE